MFSNEFFFSFFLFVHFIIKNYIIEAEQQPSVAIMTGQPDGTTLLDGQITVNSGGGGGRQMCSSSSSSSMMNNNCSNSICRIEIDGKTMASNDDKNPNDTQNHQNHKLQIELECSKIRIQKLEQQQKFLLEKIQIQSKQLLSLSNYESKRFENLDQSNQTNGLIRHYEYLYSQGKF